MLIEINENIIFKFYYKDFFATYKQPLPAILDREISEAIEIEEFLIQNSILEETELDTMLRNFQRLEGTKSEELIKGIVTYKNYPIGIIMKNYKEYERLTDIYEGLKERQKQKVMLQISQILIELEEHGIYPGDLKEDNILVRAKDLDVVIVDLDGKETRFEDEEYIKEFPHIKTNVKKRYNEMAKRLNKIKDFER